VEVAERAHDHAAPDAELGLGPCEPAEGGGLHRVGEREAASRVQDRGVADLENSHPCRGQIVRDPLQRRGVLHDREGEVEGGQVAF